MFLLILPGANAAFPEKDISLIIAFREGGGTDTQARLLASKLENILGVNVIAQNKPGKGGAISAAYIKDQPADGYTIGISVTSTFSFAPLASKVKHTVDDFTYIATVARFREVILANAKAEFGDWADMINKVKERGYLRYASVVPLDRVILQKIAKKEGFELDILPTKGGAGARQALLAGDADIVFSDGSGLRLVKDGQAKLMATFNAAAPPGYEDAPTLSSLGYEGTMVNYAVIYGPKDMPTDVVEKLGAAIKQASSDPEFIKLVTERLQLEHIQLGPEEVRTEMARQTETNSKLLEK